jgi:hypothetical protein
MNIQEQILEELSSEMQSQIDRDIFWGMLEGLGWTRIMLDRLTDNNHAIDITYWLEENIKNPFERNGRDFIFEDSKDALLFSLKWA